MSFKIDEYNVFKIPHSRMMQLVNSCNKNLDLTDFGNNDELVSLLSYLSSIFKEFKSHEDIENEHIMTKLKSKLKAMAIYNSAVCNCHKDDEFTPLINLVEMGYMYLNKTKSISEKISFGIKLRKALSQFTKKFIPHMKEEEEVFQPLLIEHFSEQELTEMKNIVIKLHMQQRKRTASHFNSDQTVHLDPKLAVKEEQDLFNQLPNELILKIFSNLSYSDKFKSARVCKKWNSLIYDKSFWKKLNINEWKINKITKYDFNLDMESIDYSDDEEDDLMPNENSKEKKILKFWIKYLLPNVGKYISSLDLSNCASLNNNLTRRILQFCPNLTYLNLSYTKIGDNSFRGVRLDKLEHLNCEGCEQITDNAFKFLLLSTSKININKSQTCLNNDDSNCLIKCKNCGSDNSNIEEIKKNSNTEDKNELIENSLRSINLSGCWSLTDYGLSYLASKYNLNDLEYLNLSGCINLTAFGLSLFIEFSKFLKGENLYYCDNIDDGPMKEEANSCDNIDCAKKFCCRTIKY